MLQKVATTGVDLESVYTQILQRIREQKGDRSRLGMEVLMWISHAERPLTIGELCLALAVEVGTIMNHRSSLHGLRTSSLSSEYENEVGQLTVVLTKR